jgi:cytochrome bd-type quinol oxidase subunit 2
MKQNRLIFKLELDLDEVLRPDFLVGLLGLAGSLWLAFANPESLHRAAPAAIGIVGVVIGAVIAGMAVVASFMDTTFLRKIHLINERAKRYVAPFAATAAIGVCAGLSLIVFVALPESAPHWFFRTMAGISGFFTFWTIASVWPLLSLALDFVELKSDAAKVPDEVLDVPDIKAHRDSRADNDRQSG